MASQNLPSRSCSAIGGHPELGIAEIGRTISRAKTALLIFVIFCSVLSHANAAQTRIVRGKVVTGEGKPVAGAVVQLKDLRTLAIRSFVTQENGQFEFSGVDSDQAYEVRAHYRKYWGDPQTVTRFDSSKVVELTLSVDITPK